MRTQPDRRDDRQQTLRSEKQLTEIGSRRCRRRTSRAQHGAVGEHGLQADDHVLDLSVARAVLPGTPAGDPATHRGQIEALRENDRS